jgi:hypothetical protein
MTPLVVMFMVGTAAAKVADVHDGGGESPGGT